MRIDEHLDQLERLHERTPQGRSPVRACVRAWQGGRDKRPESNCAERLGNVAPTYFEADLTKAMQATPEQYALRRLAEILWRFHFGQKPDF